MGRPPLDLDVDRVISDLVEAEAEKRTRRLELENAELRLRLPKWWVREYGHAAGGFAPAVVATTVLGVHPGITIGATAAWAVLFEAVLQKRLYPKLSKQHPRWKSLVDIAAWVGGAALGTLAAGG